VLGNREAKRQAGLLLFEIVQRDLGMRTRHLRRRFRRGSVPFRLGQRMLELIEDRATLGRLPEPLVPRLGDRVLQLLNQQRAELGKSR
jgi:hypothetical protein